MNTVNNIYQIAGPILWAILPIIGALILAELKRRGYQTTYIEALGRAIGTGVMAAQSKGLDPMTAAGRLVVTTAAVGYLRETVQPQADKLGILTDADHELRVNAQLGVEAIKSGAIPLLTGTVLQGTTGVLEPGIPSFLRRQPQ